MKFKRYISLFFVMIFGTIHSQNELGSWNVLNFTIKTSPKWNVFFETQLRSLSFYNQFHYYEYKGGVSYKLNNNFAMTTGLGSYNTYSEGGNFELPMQNSEIRSWFQLNLKNVFRIANIEHRYRAEQRFTSNGFRNRFRYRIGAVIPINNKKIIPKTYYFTAWNEIFFTDNEPYFERNRLFVGIGYELSNKIAVQSGYIHQFDYKINDETGRDFLNIAVLYTLDLTSKNDFSPVIHD